MAVKSDEVETHGVTVNSAEPDENGYRSFRLGEFDFSRDEYFVYIMCSLSGTLYIGMTNSIYRRALQHKRRL